MTNQEIEEIGSILLRSTVEDLREIIKDPQTPAIKACICSVAARIISKGSAGDLNGLLDRVAGRVKERVEVTGADGKPLEVFSSKPEEKVQQVKEILTFLQEIDAFK